MRRGVKPRPVDLKIVDGTFRPRTDTTGEQVIEALQPAGARPKWLTGRAAKFWDEKVAQHPEWTEAQLILLPTWCLLQAEIAADKAGVPTSRMIEHRRLTEYLFAPRGVIRANKTDDPAAEFFG